MISTETPTPNASQDHTQVNQNLAQILKLEVPIVVRLGARTMDVAGVLGLVPGAIIELPKNAESELDLMVNNRAIGCGVAVKVGENFGLRLTFLGDVRARIDAMGGGGVSLATAGTATVSGGGAVLGG
jgi:flagellar motor switch protein FliN/FliY